jgi:predicted transcriptional regulator
MVRLMDNKPAPDRKPEDRAAYLAAVDEGLADAEAKRTVPFEKVRRWLLSWGSDHELPPPKCP